MKIPNSTTPPAAPARPTPDPNKTNARNDAAPADDSPAPAEGRDFASVLEEVARPRERERLDEEDGGRETTDAKKSDRAEGDTEARRREGREGSGGDSGGGDARGGLDQRGALREVSASQESAGARAILHIADLERIVSAVRAQTLAGGVREVTIELRRSVLEGLRVRLRLDGGGRVAAEFVASTERVRAQLDARAPELAELLRSRGVNLASLTTSSGGGDTASDSRGDGGGDAELSAPSHAQQLTPSPDAADAPDATDTTYRA